MVDRAISGKTLDRRSFVTGAVATGALGLFAGGSLSGCAPTQVSDAKETKGRGTERNEVVQWVDAVSSASLATNKYTNYSVSQLQDSILSFKVECVVSTSNEDGTPNVAIFVPAGMFEDSYIAFTWAENQTKANFGRAKIGMIAFDVPDLTAETKELRHQGAVARVSLVEDMSVLERLKSIDPQLEICTFVKIIEVLPVG